MLPDVIDSFLSLKKYYEQEHFREWNSYDGLKSELKVTETKLKCMVSSERCLN